MAETSRVNAENSNASSGRGGFDFIGFAATTVAGSLASLAITGFVFGCDNNIFHLPIIDELYNEPQFAQDAYIQSLRYYASGLWLLLRGADSYFDPYWLFLGLDYLSRLLAFAGFLACADLLGVRGRKERALFAGLLCFTSLLRGFSFAGNGGLFINYFTHSEIANGLTLISLYFAARRRLTAAFGANGAVFFVNAFIGLWNALPLGMIVIYLLIARQIRWRNVVVGGAAGLIVIFVLAAPVIWNILSNPEFGLRTDFDAVDFYNQYYPYHFLFDSVTLKQKVAVVAVISIAVLSLLALGTAARSFLVAMFGYLAVYAFGIVAPHFTHDAHIFQLALLRVSTMFHLLAALGSIALAVRWLACADRIHASVLAPALGVSLCTSQYLLPLAPIVIVVSLHPRLKSLVPPRLLAWRARIGYSALICVAAAVVSNIVVTSAANRKLNNALSEWTALGEWARANTPVNAIFLLPDAYPSFLTGEQFKPFLSSQEQEVMFGASIFEYASRRRVWVDWKRGAAVMWTPSYYRVWWPRFAETRILSSHSARIAYARQKSISYVVDFCSADQDRSVVMIAGRVCLYSTPLTAKHANKG